MSESRHLIEAGRLLGLTAEDLDRLEQEMLAPSRRRGVSDLLEEILSRQPAPGSWRTRFGQGLLRASDRLRAWQIRRPPAMVLSPFDPQQSLDFLVHWWMMLRARGDHRRLCGPEAESVSGFMLQFTVMGSRRLVVLHTPGAAWEQAHGLVAVAWFTEACPERASVGYWMAPPYVHRLDVVWESVADELLRYAFRELGLQALDIPVPGRPIIITKQEFEESHHGRIIENYE